jgi:hypothetical protein
MEGREMAILKHWSKTICDRIQKEAGAQAS